MNGLATGDALPTAPFPPLIGWTYRTRITAAPAEVSRALVALHHQLRDLGLAADPLDHLELVLAEVLNNIVEHAYDNRGCGQIALRVAVHSMAIWCHVTDTGRAMPELKLPRARRYDLDAMTVGDLPEGGFGWGLIRDLTRTLSYTRIGGENRLSLSIDLNC